MLKKKNEEREKNKNNSLNIKPNTEALLFYKDVISDTSKKIRNSKSKYFTSMNLQLIKIIAGKPKAI